MSQVELEVVSPLQEVRYRLADTLEDGPWQVYGAAVDAIPGPALVILSGSLDPAAIGCTFNVHPVVICAAGRPDAPPAADIVDQQTSFVLARLQTARNIALERVEAETRIDFGGIAYLCKRVVCRTTVTIPAETL